MCNYELIESLGGGVGKLASHISQMRSQFNEIQEEFREGNMDASSLSQLSLAIHNVERDAATLEKLLEG